MRPIEEITADITATADVYPAGQHHFVYTSGMHGDGYVNYRPLGTEEGNHPLLQEVCVALLHKTISEAELDQSKKIVVIGPQTLGATMVSMLETAAEQGLLDFPHFDTCILEKDMHSHHGFAWTTDPSEPLANDAQVIWMDDLLNQGSTFRKSHQMVQEAGSSITAIAVIGDRCNLTAADCDVKVITSLQQFPGFSVYAPDALPAELTAMPIVRKPGHGCKLEKTQPDHPSGYITL